MELGMTPQDHPRRISALEAQRRGDTEKLDDLVSEFRQFRDEMRGSFQCLERKVDRISWVHNALRWVVGLAAAIWVGMKAGDWSQVGRWFG